MIQEETRTAASGYLALAALPTLALLCGEENARPVLSAGSLYS